MAYSRLGGRRRGGGWWRTNLCKCGVTDCIKYKCNCSTIGVLTNILVVQGRSDT